EQPGRGFPPGKHGLTAGCRGEYVMSIESEFLFENAIRNQEVRRSAEVERNLDTASDEISARQFAEAMDQAAKTYASGRTDQERIAGSGTVSQAHAVGIAEGGAGPGDVILSGIRMLRSAYEIGRASGRE